MSISILPIIAVGLSTTLLSQEAPQEGYQTPDRSVELTVQEVDSSAIRIRQEVSVELADGLELDLWAADALVLDPIAISIDEQGRVFYTQANRIELSEFDIRGHRDWMTASISFESVEDRRAFLRETFSETNDDGRRFLKDLNKDGALDWRDLTVEKEQVWMVEDSRGTGRADRAQLFVEDFHEEVSDLANGLEFTNGELFLAVGPDLWRLKDEDGDGRVDQKTSISHGYAVHIGFGAHGMSGVKVGPDGRIWWGIGDIGMNVVDQEGKRWKYPNQGVIVRSERDGSGFEVYAAGLRNTHEFVFDQYGNLISEDNDGDHRGERERLVYLINGSETGWRINWQFGKYTDPKNNAYKVWMDEGLNVPRWDGQPAYILPTIQNFVNGPTGMVYNPGTALGPEWYDHFFLAEFRGSPANSPIHAFTLKPDGAGFALDSTRTMVSGLLPTGLDFGPDGALYFADWIRGWGAKDEGRMWKVDVPGGADTELRQETMALLQTSFSDVPRKELGRHLDHPDMRVRQKAQFELVARGPSGLSTLIARAKKSSTQLGRIHGIWGIAQAMRTTGNDKGSKDLTRLLSDKDPEIVAQAAKMLGDIRYIKAAPALRKVLKHDSIRVRMLAVEALGRIADPDAVDPILTVMEENNDEDTWLRHAGMIALGRIGDVESLLVLKDSPSRALRTVAVVALRRMQHPGIAEFLQDEDEYIVTEAARGINDDWSITEALPALAEILDEERFTAEPLIRRSISANLRLGDPANLNRLIEFAQRDSAPAELRAEAIAALSTWSSPSLHDRVDGRYRGEVVRDAGPVTEAIRPVLDGFLGHTDSEVAIAAASMASSYGITEATDRLRELAAGNSETGVRLAALSALHEMGADGLADVLASALRDDDEAIRSQALALIPEARMDGSQVAELFGNVLDTGSRVEQQAVLTALAKGTTQPAVDLLDAELAKLEDGTLDDGLQLDLIDAVETQGDSALVERLAVHFAGEEEDPLAAWRPALEGGDRREGRRIFYENEQAQCVRCHTIFEFGGDAGPGLPDIGSRLSPEQLLESLITPSSSFAKGYQLLSLELHDGSILAGKVLDETESELRLSVASDGVREIAKADIKTRTDVPSSMPPMGGILTKREARDLIAFLSSLKSDD